MSREVRTVTSTVRVAASGVSGFVPRVEAFAQGGECEALPEGTTGPGERTYVLSFPDRQRTRRNISITLGAEGGLLRYNDLRGDLRRDRTEPMTAIVIDFARGTAIATNEVPGHPHEAVFGTPEDFLEQESLAVPSRGIEQVRSRCGAR